MTDAQRLAGRLSKIIAHFGLIAYRDVAGLRFQPGHLAYDELVLICNDLATITTAVEIGRAMGIEAAAKIVSDQGAIMFKAGDTLVAATNRAWVVRIIRSATPALDVKALTETVAEALYLHERPTMYAIEAQSQSFADLTDYARDYARDKARAVLRTLGIGGKE